MEFRIGKLFSWNLTKAVNWSGLAVDMADQTREGNAVYARFDLDEVYDDYFCGVSIQRYGIFPPNKHVIEYMWVMNGFMWCSWKGHAPCMSHSHDNIETFYCTLDSVVLTILHLHRADWLWTAEHRGKYRQAVCIYIHAFSDSVTSTMPWVAHTHSSLCGWHPLCHVVCCIWCSNVYFKAVFRI